QVIERLAPGVTSAKFLIRARPDPARTDQTPIWPWRGDRALDLDDRLAVVEDREVNPACIFTGFAVDADWQIGAAAGHCVVTAGANAHRLARDSAHLVYGREMELFAAGTFAHFSGLPTVFNAGGLGNRRATAYDLGIEGDPDRGIFPFTADGDPAASHWTVTEALEYLLWQLNGEETWIANPDLTDLYTAFDAPLPETNVDGMSLWAALAAVADRAGLDVFESFELDGAGEPVSRIRVVARGQGTVRTIKHQAPAEDGSLTPLDLNLTNLFACQVATGTANCLTSPVVAGAAPIIEISVILQPAWDPADVDVVAADLVIDPRTVALLAATADYCRQYCTVGDLFAGFADVFRLWDANTDGRYSAAPYSCSIPDVALLAQILGSPAAGTWPRVPYRPLPLVSRLGCQGDVSGRSGQSLLEVCYNADEADPDDCAWALWPGGYRILPDRLGVRLTDANLAAVSHAGAGPARWGHTFLDSLLADPGKVRLRLTCSVASPERGIAWPAARTYPGTAFATGEFVDRGGAGAVRDVAESSVLLFPSAYGTFEADGADDAADLAAMAAAIQDEHERRTIEASLPIAWPDEPIGLTDRIARIDGIDVELSTDPARAPRVVNVTKLLRPEAYGMHLTLGSYRKAPIL
ncbi:MAG TPA: hypothetical protein VMW52_07785, partial [Phycisphaerae bacterium]|nr:hypothetical protein [Phycisphaerae bacterium]